jgi:signal transduction histidine kinase
VRLVAATFGARGSLQRRLVGNLVVALLVCVAGAAILLTVEFFEHLEERAELSLRIEAEELAAQLDPDLPALGQDRAGLRFSSDAGAYRYTVFDAAWRPLLGSELGPEAAQALEAAATSGTMVPIGADRLGVVVNRELPEGPVYVLASTRLFSADRTNFLLLRHELDEVVLWLLSAVALVLTAAIVTARRAARPLRQVREQAGAIVPGAPERRLAAERLPAELAPLVEAVNHAFDRLEGGYQGQRDFASNVAHEIRTPLAVLRSEIEGIEDADQRRDLLADLGALDRLFEQLIDLARADALGSVAYRPVCMHALAADFAAEAGPGALRSGHALAIAGAEVAPAWGHPGLLTVALSNLVRNALAHSPRGSDVEIEVTADPPGWRVLDRGPGVAPETRATLFERFRRGQRKRAGPGGFESGGSGIGLAIVKSVAEGHGGSVKIEDRAGGGAVFCFRLAAAP